MELEPEARNDRVVRALAGRILVEADPQSGYPTYMSGGVSLVTADGRGHDAYVPVNNGSGARALDSQGIAEKFFAAAELAVPHARARRIHDAIVALESIAVAELAEAVRIE